MTPSELPQNLLDQGTMSPQCHSEPIYLPLPEELAAHEQNNGLLHPFLKAVSRFPDVRQEILKALRVELGL